MCDTRGADSGSRPAIIVMVKAPRSGRAKTRLIPAIGAEGAAGLAACLARDTVRIAQGIVRDVLVAYSPADGKAELQDLLPDGLLWTEQAEGDLAERLQSAASDAAELGFGPLVLIGTDSPTLPPSYVETALDSLTLDRADLVLGPAEDGGYYLAGLRMPVPHLFDDIDWSTARVYEQTAANAARLGLRVQALPSWYDVDTPRDLLHLWHEYDTSTAARTRAPATYRWLRACEALPLLSV